MLPDDCSNAWCELWAIIDSKAAAFFDVRGPKHNGRGKPSICQQHTAQRSKFVQVQNSEWQLCPHSKEAQRVFSILKQIQSWHSRLKLVVKPGMPIGKLMLFLSMNLRCITTLRGLIRSGDPLDDRLRGLMDKDQPNDISSVFPPTQAS